MVTVLDSEKLKGIWERIKVKNGLDMSWCRTGVSELFTYVKEQIISFFFGFIGHRESITTTQFCPGSMKAAMGNTQVNGHILIKVQLHKQLASSVWPPHQCSDLCYKRKS